MILYHGTNKPFEQIDLSKSKPNKDFGKGFYLTSDKQQAIDMAKAKIDQQGEGEVIVYAFEFDTTFLSSGELKVKSFDTYSEEWRSSSLQIETTLQQLPSMIMIS